MHKFAVLLAAGSLALSACAGPVAAAEEPVNTPAATRVAKEKPGLKTAIFAGGCFWGVEGVFSHVKGVTGAVSGYHGGTAKTAKYDIITSGVTTHAESVKVTYDPAVVRYDQLLRIYFAVIADPTLKNRQGPDVGAHYRTAIVPMNAEQSAVAAAYIAQLGKAKLWSKPIVTKIEPYKAFYAAEDYHQDFMLNNPKHGYILRWDAPKVAALKAMFPKLYRATFLKDAG
ncbi:peptide-methionine (S)-S-oxide reductase MsrA [Erythrobacter sp. BLCC-B19]|uniref:peptide-methionine (S)-S-oxide reductase MsrA n=1 Tax=Erythrobacter sp. BLCC-B19 TaxID=3025315 RepID=UPI00235F67CE|nr:peptide-methionine (S)-S-oxide reductase MsrA [Erythrobacter sp. BLCC-B19]WDA42218.1 peptide-methionine (S)-S-oxide reductase MsrA [Erythrobacter sp. BLCC-B19]